MTTAFDQLADRILSGATATAEEALDFLHQLIDLMLDGGEPGEG